MRQGAVLWHYPNLGGVKPQVEPRERFAYGTLGQFGYGYFRRGVPLGRQPSSRALWRSSAPGIASSGMLLDLAIGAVFPPNGTSELLIDILPYLDF